METAFRCRYTHETRRHRRRIFSYIREPPVLLVPVIWEWQETEASLQHNYPTDYPERILRISSHLRAMRVYEQWTKS